MKNKRAFTLIELMVVIAIIGLIASIVLVGLRGARQRARIAAGMQFSDTLRASLSDALVSWWSFNEGAGGAAGDTWGGNNGTVNGAEWTKGVAEDALKFDTINEHVLVPYSQNLNVAEVTVEAWVYPFNTNNWRCILMRHRDSPTSALAHVYTLYIHNSKANFTIGSNVEDVWWADGNNVPLNAWSHIVGTYNGSYIKTYVNGKESSPTSYDKGLTTSSNVLTIGRNLVWNNEFFNGIIDEVRIYNRSLTALEIQKRYAQGLEKYKLVKE